jgi:hypothetical protein
MADTDKRAAADRASTPGGDAGRRPDQEAAGSKGNGAPAPRPTTAGEDGHMGATEDEVVDVPAPSGSAFEDEPKQG